MIIRYSFILLQRDTIRNPSNIINTEERIIPKNRQNQLKSSPCEGIIKSSPVTTERVVSEIIFDRK